MTAINQETLKQRIIGRKEAEAAIELLRETSAKLSVAAMLAFWNSIREFLDAKGPNQELQANGYGPMTDTEARDFGQTEMNFGKYAGHLMCDIPLGYLDWLLGKSETDSIRLKRYLANEKVAERLRIELEQERPNG